MTRSEQLAYLKFVHWAFWPVLWWNLARFRLACADARAVYGDDILICASVSWWGDIRIAHIQCPDAPAPHWQQMLSDSRARLDAVFAEAGALHILALNWIVMARRICAISAPCARPAIIDTS